jgi:hypothetical protein
MTLQFMVVIRIIIDDREQTESLQFRFEAANWPSRFVILIYRFKGFM